MISVDELRKMPDKTDEWLDKCADAYLKHFEFFVLKQNEFRDKSLEFNDLEELFDGIMSDVGNIWIDGNILLRDVLLKACDKLKLLGYSSRLEYEEKKEDYTIYLDWANDKV